MERRRTMIGASTIDIYLTPGMSAATLSSDPEELRSEVIRLRDELRRRDDFLAFTAHELRTPLHVLTLQLSAVQRFGEAAGAAQVLTQIAKAQATLARYVDRTTVLLDLTRLDAQAYPLSPRNTDLTATLEALVESFRSEAEYHGVALRFDAPAACPACTDPRAIDHIIGNLLTNAFKHSQSSIVSLILRHDDQHADIIVVDNGRGISSIDQQRIFAKFGRAADAHSMQGFGLGLWIVSLLVEALGGRISVKSSPNEGSAFTVQVPLTIAGSPGKP